MEQNRQKWFGLGGVLLGGLAGYAYYYYVGCASGTCPITSQPWTATLYGAVMGGLTFQSFTGKKDQPIS